MTWYATERGKGRSIPLPLCLNQQALRLTIKMNDMNAGQLPALYDWQPVEQRKESRSLGYCDWME